MTPRTVENTRNRQVGRAVELYRAMAVADGNKAATSSPDGSTRDGGPAYRHYAALGNELQAEFDGLCETLGIVTIADRVRVLGI